MAEPPPFGRRGLPPKTGKTAKLRMAKPAAAPDSLLPDGAAMVARTRKRTIGLSLATAGALTAAGLWFAESGARTCVDDPATPTVDEATTGDCAPGARGSSGHSSGGHWYWRGGWSGWSGWSGSSSRASGSTLVSSTTPKSSASRGGFGSIGSFHMFGGS